MWSNECTRLGHSASGSKTLASKLIGNVIFAGGRTAREARSGAEQLFLRPLTIRETAAGATLGPRGPFTRRTLRVPLSAVVRRRAPRGRPQAPRAALPPTPRCRRGREPIISPAGRARTDTRPPSYARMASFAGSSKDTVADLLVDKSASPPPGAKPAKAPDTEKKHYSNNNDGETMEALLEGAFAASHVGAFTPCVVSRRGGRGWSLFRF